MPTMTFLYDDEASMSEWFINSQHGWLKSSWKTEKAYSVG